MTSSTKMKAVFPKTNKQPRTWAEALIWNLFMFHQTRLESNCTRFETFNCSCCFSLQIRKSWLSVKNSRSWLLVSFQGSATLIAFCFDSVPFWNWGLPRGRRKAVVVTRGFGDWGNPQLWRQARLIIPQLGGANRGARFTASDLSLWLEGLESQSFLFALFIISDW